MPHDMEGPAAPLGAAKAGLDDADLSESVESELDALGELAGAVLEAARRMHLWWVRREQMIEAERAYQLAQKAKRKRCANVGEEYEPDPPDHRTEGYMEDGRTMRQRADEAPDQPLVDLRKRGLICPVREHRMTAMAYRLALMHRSRMVDLFEDRDTTA